MPASITLKKQLRRASRDAIKEAVIRLKTHLSAKRWIGQQNIYARLYIRKPSEPIRSTNLKQRQIADYIAASIFTHCSDGWSLLGRSLNLHIKGDTNSSVHLAYYAELRAAMSILATEGIGVFNSKHVILTGATPNAVITTGGTRTHKFVWDVLEHWADRKLSAQILAEVITPGSIPLSGWLAAFGVSTHLHPVGRSWLRSWGVDIKQFGDDQILRNHSSYRPSRIVPRPVILAQDALSFSSELWQMCEPSTASRFNEIDRHLLRDSLAQIYQNAIPPFVDPKKPANLAAYKSWIERGITSLGFTAAVQANWVDFLTWKIQPDRPRILEEAGGTASIDEPNYHLQVLARAVLLLRISTGVGSKMLQEVGFTKDDLEFWWHPYAVDHGLIDHTLPVADFLDLWSDIGIALQDIEDWRSSNPVPYSYNQLSRNISNQLSLLGECERISLWGLGI